MTIEELVAAAMRKFEREGAFEHDPFEAASPYMIERGMIGLLDKDAYRMLAEEGLSRRLRTALRSRVSKSTRDDVENWQSSSAVMDEIHAEQTAWYSDALAALDKYGVKTIGELPAEVAKGLTARAW